MNLQIEVDKNKERHTVTLIGEIDVYSAPKLKDTLIPLTEIAGNEVKVDLQQTTYLDSTGLGIFIAAYKSSVKHYSTFQLVKVCERIYRLFKVTGLHSIIDVQQDDGGDDVNE